jgi:hypothetical protein
MKAQTREMSDSDLDELLTDDMVIEGGHLLVGETVDPIMAWSWDRAVELFSKGTQSGLRNLGLMLLIEDFSVPASEREEFHAGYALPLEYQRSLDRYGLNSQVVEIVWEVQLRNRANGDMRTRLRPKTVFDNDGYFVRVDDGSRRRVTNGTVPVCNLIMAKHIAGKNVRFSSALSIYDLRWECEANGGVVVSRALYSTRITVFNVFAVQPGQVAFVAVHDDAARQVKQ